jgi:hypothetical protein
LTTTFDHETHQSETSAGRLRDGMTAVRVSFTWFGTRRTLTQQQKEQAAESFGAEGSFLSAGKKLLDTRHERFRAVTTVRNRIRSYTKGISLPYPEPGLRLIRRASLDAFTDQLAHCREELLTSVERLDEQFTELKHAARERLGSLYCEADYPPCLDGLFDVTWEFPSVEPPDYLRQLNPELYEQECRKVSARFEEAVQLAEQAFIDELSTLVSHLTERLSGSDDGKPKVFRDSAVGNLREFFERFQQLNVRSSEQLDELVERCRGAVSGVEPVHLRQDDSLRRRVASQLSGVQSVLDGLLVDRPRRRVIRSPK